MGMYTELVLATTLDPKKMTARDIEALAYMVGDRDCDPHEVDIPDHDLFDTWRWSYMLTCDSYYFDGDTRSTFRYDDIGKFWVLTVRCNFKNYDNELYRFLDYLGPMVDHQNSSVFLGYSRYEENSNPTLHYYRRGVIEYVQAG